MVTSISTCVGQGILFGLVFAACEFIFGTKPLGVNVNGARNALGLNGGAAGTAKAKALEYAERESMLDSRRS